MEEVCYEKNPDYIYRRIVDQAVLVPIRQEVADMDCLYTMNDVGAFVWERLGQMALADIQAAILKEYAADPGAIAADMERFVQELAAIGAIRRA